MKDPPFLVSSFYLDMDHSLCMAQEHLSALRATLEKLRTAQLLCQEYQKHSYLQAYNLIQDIYKDLIDSTTALRDTVCEYCTHGVI